jgi:hypothetical protein
MSIIRDLEQLCSCDRVAAKKIFERMELHIRFLKSKKMPLREVHTLLNEAHTVISANNSKNIDKAFIMDGLNFLCKMSES